MIYLQRVYDSGAASKGRRFLVERLWPRGIRKTDLPLDGWVKDAAPSSDLRRWFNHDPAKWKTFRERYSRELDSNPAAWEPLVTEARRGDVTLLFSSRDLEHNNAVALRDYLARRLARDAGTGPARRRAKRAA